MALRELLNRLHDLIRNRRRAVGSRLQDRSNSLLGTLLPQNALQLATLRADVSQVVAIMTAENAALRWPGARRCTR